MAHKDPQATPIFMSSDQSPAVRLLCEVKGAGHLGLAGNARIAFGEIFIERVLVDKAAAAQRELKSLFRQKSDKVSRRPFRGRCGDSA